MGVIQVDSSIGRPTSGVITTPGTYTLRVDGSLLLSSNNSIPLYRGGVKLISAILISAGGGGATSGGFDGYNAQTYNGELGGSTEIVTDTTTLTVPGGQGGSCGSADFGVGWTGGGGGGSGAKVEYTNLVLSGNIFTIRVGAGGGIYGSPTPSPGGIGGYGGLGSPLGGFSGGNGGNNYGDTSSSSGGGGAGLGGPGSNGLPGKNTTAGGSGIAIFNGAGGLGGKGMISHADYPTSGTVGYSYGGGGGGGGGWEDQNRDQSMGAPGADGYFSYNIILL